MASPADPHGCEVGWRTRRLEGKRECSTPAENLTLSRQMRRAMEGFKGPSDIFRDGFRRTNLVGVCGKA